MNYLKSGLIIGALTAASLAVAADKETKPIDKKPAISQAKLPVDGENTEEKIAKLQTIVEAMKAKFNANEKRLNSLGNLLKTIVEGQNEETKRATDFVEKLLGSVTRLEQAGDDFSLLNIGEFKKTLKGEVRSLTKELRLFCEELKEQAGFTKALVDSVVGQEETKTNKV